MRQSLLVAMAVLAWHSASSHGMDRALAFGVSQGVRPIDLSVSSGAGRESTPSPDAAPLRILEGKREKNENEDDTEASAGIGPAFDGPHRLALPSRSRSGARRDLAAAPGPPPRFARLRC